ncbi:MAG: hypothetical protein KBD79_12740, partial [Chitinophagales bacterium]|nr:hypothetical protein [Chitinophagales bacterium]
MKKIYLLTIISLLIISCEKESGPTKINGSVKDKTTNAGIENAEVGLFETDGESAFGLGGVLIDEIYSDADGKFTFDFEARKGYSYYVQAIKDQFWNNQTDNITFVENTGGETDVTVFLQPEGWLSIRLHNINVYNPTDYISVSDIGLFYGNAIDTTVVQIIYGNQENRIVWGIVIDGIPPEVNEFIYIYCPA